MTALKLPSLIVAPRRSRSVIFNFSASVETKSIQRMMSTTMSAINVGVCDGKRADDLVRGPNDRLCFTFSFQEEKPQTDKVFAQYSISRFLRCRPGPERRNGRILCRFYWASLSQPTISRKRPRNPYSKLTYLTLRTYDLYAASS